jgi:hypothetical protein
VTPTGIITPVKAAMRPALHFVRACWYSCIPGHLNISMAVLDYKAKESAVDSHLRKGAILAFGYFYDFQFHF